MGVACNKRDNKVALLPTLSRDEHIDRRSRVGITRMVAKARSVTVRSSGRMCCALKNIYRVSHGSSEEQKNGVNVHGGYRSRDRRPEEARNRDVDAFASRTITGQFAFARRYAERRCRMRISDRYFSPGIRMRVVACFSRIFRLFLATMRGRVSGHRFQDISIRPPRRAGRR